MDFLTFYQREKQRLESLLSAYNGSLAPAEREALLSPFLAAFADLNSGGKRLRGVFVNLGNAIASGDASEEQTRKSDRLAVAFEIFQTAVLIHDDVIDHARLRRGKETIGVRYANSLAGRSIVDPAGDTPASAAVCTGDLGLYAANTMIAEAFADDPRLGKLLLCFNGIVTDTIRGELLDVILPCEIRDAARSAEETADLLSSSVRKIYELKTARYSVVGPLHLGMLYGGASEELLSRVDAFALELGIGFQIKDDILGIFADENVMGKDAGGDIAEAKLTVLYEYVRLRAPEFLEKLERYYGKEPVTKESVRAVQEVFQKSGALAYAKEMLEACTRRAEALLPGIPVTEEGRELLLGMLRYLHARTF